MTLNSEGLLPCPFCGGAAEIEHSIHEDNHRAPRDFHHVRVICGDCEVAQVWLEFGEMMDRHREQPEAQVEAERKAIAAWNRRALRSSVKPLEWVELNEGKAFRALLPVIGSIRIEPYGVCGWWEVLWSMPGQCDKLIPDVFDTPDEAKAAAQADYEQRILSAIEAPAAEGEVTDAMVDAAHEAIERSFMTESWEFGPPSSLARSIVTAALKGDRS